MSFNFLMSYFHVNLFVKSFLVALGDARGNVTITWAKYALLSRNVVVCVKLYIRKACLAHPCIAQLTVKGPHSLSCCTFHRRLLRYYSLRPMHRLVPLGVTKWPMMYIMVEMKTIPKYP